MAVGASTGHGAVSLAPFSLEDACVERDELPRMSLRGNPTIDLEGGACTIDDGFLILGIGYEAHTTARLQPEPTPRMLVVLFVRAVPGTWHTGSIYISPTGAEYRDDHDHSLVVTISDDLLTGTFTWSRGSGSYSCPRLLTPEEALEGRPDSSASPDSGPAANIVY